MKTKLLFQNTFPKPQSLADFPILIYDIYLLKNPSTAKWIESFPHRLGVTAGEKLKQLKSFEKIFIDLLKLVDRLKTKNITLVGLGGGSVGDFVGFTASVFKRGIPLIHIPSTWLAAIDSSHGGKTALNVAGYKNQMGTFYPAQKIYLIRTLLFTQPHERVQDAMGEVLKTLLLDGGKSWKASNNLLEFSKNELWKLLPKLIKYKYKIVSKDPLETKGIRFFLNFGHTFGHVLESIHQLPHGTAVNYGLHLALELSLEKKILSPGEYSKIVSTPLIKNHLVSSEQVKQLLLKTRNLRKYFLQDKKASKNGLIRFVFLKKLGAPEVHLIPIDEIINFANRYSREF